MRQKVGLLSGWIVAAVVVGVGLAGPNEVRTRRVVIEDGDGSERIVLDVKNGVAGVSIFTADGQLRAKLGVSKPPASEGFLIKGDRTVPKGGVIVP